MTTEKMPDRPPLTITLTTGQKIKMTYGLEMDLRRLLPEPGAAMQLVLTDPFTQDFVIRRCLSTEKKMIEDLKELPEVEAELEPDDIDNILMWAVNHVLYFFMKRALNMRGLGEQYPMTLLNPSTNGSPDSASTTPSAGPSESSKENSTT